MSIKDDISMVKDELNSEEKFFEKAVMTEKFVKKYKNVMIGSVVAIVVLVSANIIYDANKNATIEKANNVLATLSVNPTDEASKSLLKTLSPAMYDVWLYSQAVADNDFKKIENLKNSKDSIIKDLVSYELAQDSKNISALSDYASKQDSIYKDLALVQSAVFLMNENKMEEAHQKLVQVSKKSSLNQVVQALLHYGVK